MPKFNYTVSYQGEVEAENPGRALGLAYEIVTDNVGCLDIQIQATDEEEGDEEEGDEEGDVEEGDVEEGDEELAIVVHSSVVNTKFLHLAVCNIEDWVVGERVCVSGISGVIIEKFWRQCIPFQTGYTTLLDRIYVALDECPSSSLEMVMPRHGNCR